MILRYVTNLKLAKRYQASKPKLQEDKGMIELFEHTFGLQKELCKIRRHCRSNYCCFILS